MPIYKLITFFGLLIIQKYTNYVFILDKIEVIKQKEKEKEKLKLYKQYNKIAVSYGLNNNNFYPTFVSITSLLENANYSTFYTINILVSKRKKYFSNENKIKFKNLEYKYPRCKIKIIEINDKFFKFANIRRYPISAYYRLLLADLLPEIKRIIYLDGDTIVLTDLTELINLNMKNNTILGFVDNSFYLSEDFGIKTYNYITSGVMLINLENIRKEFITEQFFSFIKKYKNNLKQEDQTVINIVLNGKIGFLPPKYGIWDYNNITLLKLHNHYLNYSRNVNCYKDNDLIKGLEYPSILHYVLYKPYRADNYKLNTKFVNVWLYYAKKTNEYKNIIKYYNFKLLK